MRFGPLPRITTLGRSTGAASSSSSYVEYKYGVNDSNSAAQVSTRLKTGRTPSSFRRARTLEAFTFHNFAISSSLAPDRFDSSSNSAEHLLKLVAATRRST